MATKNLSAGASAGTVMTRFGSPIYTYTWLAFQGLIKFKCHGRFIASHPIDNQSALDEVMVLRYKGVNAKSNNDNILTFSWSSMNILICYLYVIKSSNDRHSYKSQPFQRLKKNTDGIYVLHISYQIFITVLFYFSRTIDNTGIF